MRNFSFTRPLLIFAVAFLTKSLTGTIALLLGANKETADLISTGLMVVAAIIAFTRLNKQKNNGQKK